MTSDLARSRPTPPLPLPAAEPAGLPKHSPPPRFSIVIPALDEELFIADCLTSIAAQDFAGEIEIIVVDNNCSDATADIARTLGATVVVESRPGVCWARQSGTAAAVGEIIVSTDADTTFPTTWLSSIDRSFRRNEMLVGVAGPCRFVAAPRWGAAYSKLLFGLVHLAKRLTGRVFYITATNIAFRREAWTGYDTQLTQGGDELDLLRRLQARGPVAFDLSNSSLTSARRLNEGFFYNVTVTFLYYYVLGYGLNRLFRRPVLPMAPAFRRR